MSFFFFKQETAYEMRLSDWSSDVCSSDLDSDTHALAKIDKAVAGIMAAIEDGLYQPSMKARMAELEREKAEITTRPAEAPVGIPYVHPGIAEIYNSKLAQLPEPRDNPRTRHHASADIRPTSYEYRRVRTES